MFPYLKKFRRWAWVGIILLPIASFGLLRDLSLRDLVTGADWIVVGKVETMESRWNDARDYIYTYVTLSVSDYWKNPLSQPMLTIQIPGGTVEDISQRVTDTPDFRVGETVILFLFNQDGERWVYGWEKGKFTIENGQVLESGIPLEAFKQQVIDLQKQGVQK
jgi:hypothetical protein